MKSTIALFSLGCTLVLFFWSPLCSNAYDMSDYTAYPLMVTNPVPPNILVVVDVSGSMQFPAYWTCSPFNYFYDNQVLDFGCTDRDNPYTPGNSYYGYFHEDKYYQYSGSKFNENSSCTDTDYIGSSNTCISGRLLNFATMTRIDLLRKALAGGKGNPEVGDPNTLSGSGARWYFNEPTLNCTFRITGGSYPNMLHDITIEDYGGTCAVGNISDKNITVNVSAYTRGGIIINLMDQDGDGSVDDDAPRFGLMFFGGSRKGKINTGIDGASFSSFLTGLQNEAPYGGTPTGEALWEAIDYYKQSDDHSYEDNNSYVQSTGSSKDPWYEDNPPVPVKCRKSFVLLLSDGMWNGSVDPVVPAREGFYQDIRPDASEPNLPGKQNIALYTVYMFDNASTGKSASQQIAMYGNFDDYDSDTWPHNRTGYPADSRYVTLPASPCLAGSTDTECREWDKDSNGLPDTYYVVGSDNAANIEEEIMNAINDILSAASSGTSVSVLSTSATGEGNIFQSYFLPSKLLNNRKLSWLGYLLSLGVDREGNIQDKDGNTITFSFNSSEGQTYVNTTSGDVLLTDWTNYNWELGDRLKNVTADSRTIITFLDGKSVDNGNGICDTSPDYCNTTGGELMSFTTANAAALEPYLDPEAGTTASDIIDFIRGKPVSSNYRERTCVSTENADGTGEWKLGDIITSTPTIVASPAEGYHLAYGDSKYANFFDSNNSRKIMTYIGANDGMLHAVLSDPSCTAATPCFTNKKEGDELWAYIPYNLLPHLKWLIKKSYTHVYYVDMRPKVTDINFSDMDTDGWRTVLIGGMRFGGGEIDITADFDADGNPPDTARSFKAAYFAIDITDPNDPKVLWEFTHPDLGFTSSYPAIAKVGNKWFVIVGSGPESSYTPDYTGASTQTGKVFVIDAKNSSGAWTEDTNYWIFDTGITNSFMGNPLSIDMDFNRQNSTTTSGTDPQSFNTEVVYIGQTYDSGGSPKWRGNMWRLVMNKNDDPGSSGSRNWSFNRLFNGDAFSQATPIIASPTATLDEDDNLWVFFGTGRFYSEADKSTTTVHAFYGIRDSYWDSTASTWKPCWDKTSQSWNTNTSCTTGSVTSTAVLYASSDVTSVTEATDKVTSFGTDIDWNTFVNSVTTSSTYRGWYITFDAGDSSAGKGSERMVTRPAVIGETAFFTTFIPDSGTCTFGGNSNLYSIFYKTGTAYKDTTIGEEGETTVTKKISLGYGIASSPAIHVGQEQGAVALVQTSTGAVIRVSFKLRMPRSGVISWKTTQ